MNCSRDLCQMACVFAFGFMTTSVAAQTTSPAELIVEGDLNITQGNSIRATAIFNGNFTFHSSSFVQVIFPTVGNFYTFNESYTLTWFDDDGDIVTSLTHVNTNPVDLFGRPGYLTNRNDVENLFSDGVATFELTMDVGSITVNEIQVNVGGFFTPDPVADTDGDGVADDLDNCLLTANPDQTDSNADGFGNLCDADLNDDCVVNVQDLGVLREAFFSADADADFNGDGVVNVGDLGIMRLTFFVPPGPSAVASCAE